jgi:hypothetical protein
MPDAPSLKAALTQTCALLLADLRTALRYLAILLAAALCLVALVLASLPRELFNSADLPRASIALAYGHDDALMRNLTTELAQIEVVERFYVCSVDEAQGLLDAREVDAIIILPDDLFDALVRGAPSTVTVKATEPLMGSVVFAIVERAVMTMDSLQGYTLTYLDAARASYDDADAAYGAVRSFTMVLLGDALSRLSSVEQAAAVSPYYLQVLTLLLFIVASMASLFSAVTLARHHSSGFTRRLTVRSVPFACLCCAQILSSGLMAFLLCLACGLLLHVIDPSFGLLAFAASGFLLSLVLTPLFALFGTARLGRQGASTRTLLVIMALSFLLLFAGGGFYPSFLTQTFLRTLNPVWLANMLASWTLGSPPAAAYLAVFAALPVACIAGWFLQWRLLR